MVPSGWGLRRSGWKTIPAVANRPAMLASGTEAPRTVIATPPPDCSPTWATGAKISTASPKIARGKSGRTGASRRCVGPSLRVMTSYSRPESDSPAPSRPIRIAQTLSKPEASPAIASGSSDSTAMPGCERGLPSSAIVTAQGAPTKRRTSAVHAESTSARRLESIRVSGSIAR
jgi:hypothetical protein